MKRRIVIRNIAFITGRTKFLPSCSGHQNDFFPLKKCVFTGTEQDMLPDLSETILPSANTFFSAITPNTKINCYEVSIVCQSAYI
jgi:hypothetical protein